MDFNSNDFRDQLEAILFKIRTGFIQVSKLLVYGLLCGTLVGLVASIFALGIDYATALRGQHPWVIFLMPIGAAVIVFFYQKFDHSEGTDTVLLAITRNESVPGTLAPLIFCSTITSHFLGASVVRYERRFLRSFRNASGCHGHRHGDQPRRTSAVRRAGTLRNRRPACLLYFRHAGCGKASLGTVRRQTFLAPHVHFHIFPGSSVRIGERSLRRCLGQDSGSG